MVNRDLLTVHTDHLQKTKKEFKNSKKQEIRTIFTKMNLINLGVNMHANKSAFNNEKLVKDLHKPIIRKF